MEKRIKSLEELFHKQSILSHSSEIVTNAQLQNYLDALTAHVEKHFQDKVETQNQAMTQAMQKLKNEVKELLKDKASRAALQREYNYILEIVKANESKLDQILHGYEVVIDKKIANKAEIRDVEVLESSKADISAVQEVLEKVQRMEMIINEGFGLSIESNGGEEEGSNYSNDEVDPEELKDQVNYSGDLKRHPNSTASLEPHDKISRKDSQFSREENSQELKVNIPPSPIHHANNKSVVFEVQKPRQDLKSEAQLIDAIQHHDEKKKFGGRPSRTTKMAQTHNIAKKPSKQQHEHPPQEDNHQDKALKPQQTTQAQIQQIMQQQQPLKSPTSVQVKENIYQLPSFDSGLQRPSTIKQQAYIIGTPFSKLEDSDRIKIQTAGDSLQSSSKAQTPKDQTPTSQIRPASELEEMKLEATVPTIGVKIKLSGRRERIETSSNHLYENEMNDSIINKDRTPKDFISNASSTHMKTSKCTPFSNIQQGHPPRDGVLQ